MRVSTYTVPIDDDKAGLRLDRALADALPGLSRTRIQALIAAGRIHHEDTGLVTNAAHVVRGGEVFIVAVPADVPAGVEPEPIPLEIVYEDEDVIIVNKPPGLVVHPGPGNQTGTLVNALLHHCGRLSSIGAPLRPGIVHRLDKDTSGLLVAAKTDVAHLGLAKQFALHTVDRAYVAVAYGLPTVMSGRIGGNIGRDPNNRKRMAVVVGGGKPAVTEYQVVDAFAAVASTIECRPFTGRTHQIRVHLAHLGHSIVGDALYGRRRAKSAPLPMRNLLETFPRQALHAFLIGFNHPRLDTSVRFQAEISNDIKLLLRSLKAF